MAAALAMLLTLPFALATALQSNLRGTPVVRPLLAVRPRSSGTVPMPGDTLLHYELAGANGWLRHWPQLWNIVRGEFAWIGNRPLSPELAARLTNDFERLWLASPPGLISLADAEGCTEIFSDEARAHASYYAAQASWRLDLVILARALFFLILGVPYSRVREGLVHLFQSSQPEGRSAQ